MVPNIYSQLEIPKGKKETSISRKEAEFIYRLLKSIKVEKTIEVGFAYGCSTAYIISATHKPHYAIDPYQNKYGNLGLKNIRKLGFNKYLVFISELSHNALASLIKENQSFDFAFIDGGHKYDDVFIDFYFIDLLLNIGGYVLFDDTWMRSVQLVASWIKTNKKNYKEVKSNNIPSNFVLFQKIGNDKRVWWHFEEFYNRKSIGSHNRYKQSQKKNC